MKQTLRFLIFSGGLFLSSLSFGQLQNGSIAPNFTLTDINGTSQTLYDYLDAGKTVYIDFFACHCPTCWNYHNSHALSNLYDQYGPNTAADNIFVFAIELDPNNGTNEFYGISGNTQGNWVQGTHYPQINPEGTARNTIISDYEVNYYPLIYAICPDRTITVIGKKNTELLYAHTATCDNSLGVDETEKSFSISQTEKTITIQSAIDFNTPATSIILTDIQGKQVFKKNFTEASETINLENVNQGIYFIRIVQDTRVIFSQKFQF